MQLIINKLKIKQEMAWIKSKVVMLPIEKATILYKFEETNKLIFSNHPNQHELATPQHLYFTKNYSDEEIKELP